MWKLHYHNVAFTVSNIYKDHGYGCNRWLLVEGRVSCGLVVRRYVEEWRVVGVEEASRRERRNTTNSESIVFNLSHHDGKQLHHGTATQYRKLSTTCGTKLQIHATKRRQRDNKEICATRTHGKPRPKPGTTTYVRERR